MYTKRYSLTMGKVKHDKGSPRLHNYRTKYNQDNMVDATQALKDGISVKLAAARFRVSRTKMGRQNQGPNQGHTGQAHAADGGGGEDPCQAGCSARAWGFPLNLRDFRELVKSYLDVAGRMTVFKDNFHIQKFVITFFYGQTQGAVLQQGQ